MFKGLRNDGWRWARPNSRLIGAVAIFLVAAAALPAFASTASAAGTGTVVVCATDSTGANIVLGGDQAWIQINGGSTAYVGAVGGSGCRESTVPGGTSVATWVAKHGSRSGHQVKPVGDGEVVTFNFYTTKVTVQYSGGLAFGGPAGDSDWFNKPSEELFSDGVTPVHFRLDGTGGPSGRTTLLWPEATGTGATYAATLAVARVLDSTNTPLAGVSSSGYAGGWFSGGVTDANGNAVLVHDGLGAITSVRATYLGTSQQINQNSLVNSIYHFQTIDVVVELDDSNGAPLDGGDVSYYAGGWYTIGATVGGVVHREMLPGSYSFAVVYNHSRQQVNGIDVSSTNPVVFQTGNVNIHYSGSAVWYYGGYYSFATPQELLPGDIIVYLYGSPLGRCEVPITVTAGGHLNQSGVVATLRDSTNHGTPGGVATAYVGGWKSVGTTDAGGRACALFNGTLGNTSVAMVIDGTRQQITQHQPTNSIYAFQTTDVAVQLKDSTGTALDTGSASYYAGGWHALGNTVGGVVHVQMLPGSYSFAMTYEGTRQQQNSVNITTTNPVVFQTINVAVQLKDSTGAALDTGSASYYAGGWHTIGNTTGGVANVEMLPGSYSFAMTYQGTRQQQNSVNIMTTNPVVFQTIDVAVELQDHSGSALDTGTASYYAGGWHTIGVTSGGVVHVEMLPGSYSFAMTYKGTRAQQNSVNIAGGSVIFKTTQVISDAGTATGYYAGGWQPFTSGAELLPGTYTFKFSDIANTAYAVSGTDTHIH
ncbi:MAG: hypothetical protein H6676_00825 [Thermoflexaceae bacterium]|nr:hypothetical protein [Thermoflexaceae bacterium]